MWEETLFSCLRTVSYENVILGDACSHLMIMREDVTSPWRIPEQKAGNTGVIGDSTKSTLESSYTQICCGIINILSV